MGSVVFMTGRTFCGTSESYRKVFTFRCKEASLEGGAKH